MLVLSRDVWREGMLSPQHAKVHPSSPPGKWRALQFCYYFTCYSEGEEKSHFSYFFHDTHFYNNFLLVSYENATIISNCRYSLMKGGGREGESRGETESSSGENKTGVIIVRTVTTSLSLWASQALFCLHWVILNGEEKWLLRKAKTEWRTSNLPAQ